MEQRFWNRTEMLGVFLGIRFPKLERTQGRRRALEWELQSLWTLERGSWNAEVDAVLSFYLARCSCSSHRVAGGRRGNHKMAGKRRQSTCWRGSTATESISVSEKDNELPARGT